ncbi:MAG: heparin lyase I family protein [Cyclobacteriaceae bacterium]
MLGFEHGSIDPWEIVSPPYGESRISILDSNTRDINSKFSAMFEISTSGESLDSCRLKRGVFRNSCRHLEIKIDAPRAHTQQGITTEYKWSFQFQQLPMNRAEFTIMQFHTKHSHGGSPVLQLKLKKDFSLAVSSKKWVLDESIQRVKARKKNKYEVLTEQYGRTASRILENKWYDVILDVKWELWNSESHDGFVKLKIKDEDGHYVPFNIGDSLYVNDVATMNTVDQDFRLGAYWGNKFPSETILLIDEVSIEVKNNLSEGHY